MQTSALDNLIKEAVYNAPHPLTLDQIMDVTECPDQSEVVKRALYLTVDGLMDTVVENGITYFTP